MPITTIMSDSCNRKIVDRVELLAAAGSARAAGHTIVHCHGCFDIVHPGHIRYLEFARRQGDLLVVSLTGDAQVSKGDQRPYIPEELRAENLAALEVVDLVYVNPHATACELMAELRPDIYVKGREYEHSRDSGFLAERQVVESYGGRVLFSSGEVVFSSSRLIDSFARQALPEVDRVSLLCRRHGICGASLNGLLDAFAGLKVLVIGDVIVDRYVLCDATELASEAPMMSLVRLEDRVYVGGAGIVARHVAGLGAKTYLLSSGAHDELSSLTQATLEKDGIETHLLGYRPRLPEKTRYLVDTTKLFRVEDAASCPLDSVAERQAVGWVERLADDLDAVIFCDFGYGMITRSLLARMREVLGGRVRVMTADVSGPRGLLLEFRDATLLCPTERELRAASHDYQNGLSTVAWNAMEATQARHIIVTLGKKGLVVFERQTQDPRDPSWRGRLRSEYLPSLAEHAVDPMGGGDALLATATLVLGSGGGVMQAAYLGAAAAAIEVGRLGNTPVDAYALRRWLGGRVELASSSESQVEGDGSGGEVRNQRRSFAWAGL